MTAPKKGPWRDTWGHFVARRLWHKRCPHPSCQVRAWSDEQLMDHFMRDHASGKDISKGELGAVTRELDRRDRKAETRRRRAERGRARRLAEMRDHQDYIEQQYAAADSATRGHLLSKAGKAAGVSALSLWTGPEERARRYASEELRHFWDQHGRLTLTERRRQEAANRRAERDRDEDRRLYGIY